MLTEFIERIRATLTGSSARDLEDERTFHIEMAAKRNESRGMDPVEARRRAMLTYGGADRFDEEIRDVQRARWLEDFARDVRHALRALRRTPTFALAAVLTLAIGIGANTAIFSVMNAVLLRPLPYTRPAELVSFKPEWYGAYQAFSKASSFANVAAYTNESANVSTSNEPVRSWVMSVTSSLLPTLGVAPFLGHNFTAADDAPGGARHVMLSYRFWNENFGADRGIVGRTITLDGVNHEVIGVLPETLEFPAPARRSDGSMPVNANVWTGAGGLDDLTERGGFFAIARLAPGATVERAQSEITTLAKGLDNSERASKLQVQSVVESVTHPIRPALLVFTASVALVLLVACANLGSLLLARLAGRTREIAVRTALGASGGRVVRQIVAEGIVLSALGGACAIFVGWGLLHWMMHAAPPDLPRLQTSHIDKTVLVYTLALSIATGLLIGFLPALSVMRRRREALVGGTRGAVTDRSTTRAHRVLVACDMGFAVILLVGASLLLRSYESLTRVSPGFDPHGLITADVHLASSGYAARPDVLQFFDRATSRLAAIPGVTAVSAIDRLPYGPSFSSVPLGINGNRDDGGPGVSVAYNASARPGYFAAMGIPIVEGREFAPTDATNGPMVVILSKSAADQYWPDGHAVGAQIMVFHTLRTVIGVAGDVRHFGPTTPVDPMVYLPQSQDAATRRGMTFVIRTKASSGEMQRAVRDALRAMDGTLPISNLRSFDDLRAQRTAGQRFTAQLISSFALLAALLAAVGIYGVMSFAVSQRRREIGLRMALGAERTEVLSIFLRRALLDAAPGAIIGALIAIPLTRFARGLLFGVAPLDGVSFAGALLFVILLSLAAAFVPARRAAATDARGALSE